MKAWNVPLLLIALFSVGCSSLPAAGSVNAPTPPATLQAAPTVAALDCGTIRMLGPNPPTGTTARQSEDCFWNAYQQKQSARLVVNVMGVDAVETHTFALDPRGNGVTITDTVERTFVPDRQIPPQTYTCTTLQRSQGGLAFLTCGDEGDFTVPAPV